MGVIGENLANKSNFEKAVLNTEPIPQQNDPNLLINRNRYEKNNYKSQPDEYHTPASLEKNRQINSLSKNNEQYANSLNNPHILLSNNPSNSNWQNTGLSRPSNLSAQNQGASGVYGSYPQSQNASNNGAPSG